MNLPIQENHVGNKQTCRIEKLHIEFKNYHSSKPPLPSLSHF